MKPKEKLFISIKISLLILLFSCDPADNRLKIINDSNSNIYFFCSCDSSLNNLKILRNGYYKNKRGDSSNIVANEYIREKSSKNIRKFGRDAWLRFFDSCESGSVHFYIFADSTVNKHSDKELKNRKMFAKHYVYTTEELEQNNWTIRYQ